MTTARFHFREWAEFNNGRRAEREVNPRPQTPPDKSGGRKVALVGRSDLHAVHVLMPKNGLGDRVLLEHTGEPVNVGPRLDGRPAEFAKVQDAMARFVKVAEGFARLSD